MKEVNIKGTIIPNDDKWIYDWCEIEATCPRDVENILSEANGDDVIVKINSGGGDVFSGNEIYYLLNTYKGNLTIDIVGFAGSAASIIAMARQNRMVATGMIMIHNASTSARGDYHVMDKSSNILRTVNSSICNSYRLKTGMSEEELLSLMDEETWLTAQEAKEKGFIDEIINDTENKLSVNHKNLYNSSFANILSPEVIEKIRNEIKMPKSEIDDSVFFMHQNRLLDKKMKLAQQNIQEKRRIL